MSISLTKRRKQKYALLKYVRFVQSTSPVLSLSLSLSDFYLFLTDVECVEQNEKCVIEDRISDGPAYPSLRPLKIKVRSLPISECHQEIRFC